MLHPKYKIIIHVLDFVVIRFNFRIWFLYFLDKVIKNKQTMLKYFFILNYLIRKGLPAFQINEECDVSTLAIAVAGDYQAVVPTAKVLTAVISILDAFAMGRYPFISPGKLNPTCF